jgi:uncharacterized membrane protein
MGMNMVIGIGCAYIGADYLARQYGLTNIQRVSVSLGAMIFVMMLEMILFIIRATRFDELDKRRRKRMESSFAPAVGMGLSDGAVLAANSAHLKKTN